MKLYEIGPKIKELRKSKNMTQKELALKANISRVTLGKLERGEVANVSIKVLDTILNSLSYEINFTSVQGFGLPTLDEL